jgi:hypothetical protein
VRDKKVGVKIMIKSMYERLSNLMKEDVSRYEDLMAELGNDTKSLSTLALQAIVIQLTWNNKILLEINKDKLGG